MKDTMRAIAFRCEGEVELVTRPIPELKHEDDVLIKVLAASICGSDLGITAIPPKHPGKPGVILGHECVAEVVALASPSEVLHVGDRVLMNPMVPCGECENCKMGRLNTCSNVKCVGEDYDGVFAEYYVSKRSLLYPISKDVPVDIAVFAEPLACVMNGFQRVQFLPGQSVLILGAGPIGLLFAKLARAAGASYVFLSETAPFRIDFAKEHTKVDRVINPMTEDMGEVIASVAGVPTVDLVVDTVGNQIATGVTYASVGGCVLLFGMNVSAQETVNQSEMNWKELRIVASVGTLYTFPVVRKILESNILDLEELLTTRIPLEETGKGLEMLRRGEAMKVVIYP